MEQEAFRGKLWVVFGMEHFLRMWEHFTVKRTWAKAVLADAGNRKAGMHARQIGRRSRHSKRSWH